MSATRRGPCPQCDRGARDSALAITTDERGTVSFCHRCGFTEVNNHTSSAGSPPAPKSYRPWRELADYLWRSSVPLAGSLAATYLQRRGCLLPPADGDLRFLPGHGEHPAALVARVTDVLTAEPISLHFTRLNPDGTKAGEDAKRLLAGHRKQGGCIRLWPDSDVTHGLAIAEGIETALSAAHVFTPVWSTIDAGNLSDWPVLNGIESLTIFADNDDAGIGAARACASRLREAGREVRIRTPLKAGHDINDIARSAHAAA